MHTRDRAAAITDVRNLFSEQFTGQPQGVWSAPGRVNLIGEHVDYAGGICLPFALSQRTYVAARANNDGVYRIASHWSGGITRAEIPTEDVRPGHPADWTGYIAGAVWAAWNNGTMPAAWANGITNPGLDIAIESDVPVGAGLSSSAALECSTALAAWEISTGSTLAEQGQVAQKKVLDGLRAASIQAENDVVGASTGGLDQTVALFGKAGNALAIDFATNAEQQVTFDIDSRGLAILIINTNAPHQLADGQYAARRAVTDGVAADLGVPTLRQAPDAVRRCQPWADKQWNSWSAEQQQDMPLERWRAVVEARVRHVETEIDRTARAIEVLRAGEFRQFGELMQASHASLRDDYEVTVPELDTAVEVALRHGALGARMTGGGFGGSAIALVDASQAETVAAHIASSFADAGFARPEFAIAIPSEGARREE
ncbi:galactokinase [Corynebacterium auriscanis]|uniref:galactokinase n=1 Tax=Corynebacterium auriscanis TaxID=99807 RepID=UPI0022467F49|nr:galactokinase [Corynebacterium auriscanis]MCX2163482.1 galactokinase [Corynebacterium auriscanis]